MKLIAVLCVFAAADNPVSKVLQLLSELQQKVIKDGEAEQKEYEAFAEWCEDSAVAKQYEIKDGKAKVEELQAVIEKEGATIANLDAKIEELAATITTNQADLKAATEIRDKEASDFATADADLAETIDMLGRAIGIIAKNMKGSFVQADVAQLQQAFGEIVNAASLQTKDKAKLQALIQASQPDEDFLARSAPDPKAYETHSTGILDVLEDMKDKAMEMRHEGQVAEMNSKHSFEMLAQSLNDAVKNDSKIMNEAKANKATSEEAKSAAEGDLAATSKELAADEKNLADLSADCQQKAADWAESQASRKAELQALVDAKKIIEEKTGGAASQAYGFAEVNAKSKSMGDAGDAVLSRLRKLQGSDVALAQLTLRVQATLEEQSGASDVFAKVKGLIQDMIEKLVADAAAEASHKAFCDKEMADSQAKIADHTSQIEKFTTRKDKAVAAIDKATADIAQKQKELAEIAKMQAEMDKLRAEQKASFEVAEKDYTDGIEGLTMALQILRDYYAADASLIQQPAVSTHSAATGAATGIIGLLEVAQSDFSKLLADAKVAEDSQQREYEKVSQENRVSTAMKQTSVKALTKEVAELKQRVSELSSDIEGEQTELDAVTEYYDKLKPGCIAKPEPYAERKRRREAEIAGLKEALSILEGLGDDSFLAVRSVRRHQ